MSNNTDKREQLHVGIVGGGIAGVTAAILLGRSGIKVSLFDKKPGLVYGPPICHLHAGGNLYRDISLAQCKELLRQSIDSVKLYPNTINVRPTIIAVPDSDKGDPASVIGRLKAIRDEYQSLVDQCESNKVLGEPQNYFRLFSRDELIELSLCSQSSGSLTDEDWVIPFAKTVDLDKLKYPVVLVQEYGWSLFRLAATAQLDLEQQPFCHVHLSSQVNSTKDNGSGWTINYSLEGSEHSEKVDYLINACGFETGTLDNWLSTHKSRLVEFKAAYVSRWQSGYKWPEVVFHGKRGTPDGMAQLTPYPDGVFQLHGMTDEITLFKNGLVSSGGGNSQPQLPQELLNKIKLGWSDEVKSKRTDAAIRHMSRFIPSFCEAEYGGKPLFGAQQIPGSDASLRASDVSFYGERYARLEIVKGSSAIEAARKVIKHIQTTFAIEVNCDGVTLSHGSEQVESLACQLAVQRGYPRELAKIY